MICPICSDQGLKSRVYPDPTSTVTLMASSPGYWDEDGKWHEPVDPNIRSQGYSCSNGHRWGTKTQYGKTEVILPASHAVAD